MKFLNENPATVITPLVRYALIFIGGGLVSKGAVSAEDVNTFATVAAGAISTLAASTWMFAVKYRNKKNGGGVRND